MENQVKRSISNMFQVIPCVIANLSRKCRENPFIQSSKMFSTGTDSPNTKYKNKSCMDGIKRSLPFFIRIQWNLNWNTMTLTFETSSAMMQSSYLGLDVF